MLGDQTEVKSIASEHYDDSYFRWQNTDAAMGALLNRDKFIEFIKPEHRRILDFGCGGGWLLNCIDAETKVGVEINPAAQAHARSIGIEAHSQIADIPSASIDMVISHHALEHVESPFNTLLEMKRVLRSGGLLAIVVPCDRVDYAFNENDQDFHLYSWSAGNLGNLAKAAGFSVLSISEYVHRWPPKWAKLLSILGPKAFNLLCRLNARIQRDRTQVRLIATR